MCWNHLNKSSKSSKNRPGLNEGLQATGCYTQCHYGHTWGNGGLVGPNRGPKWWNKSWKHQPWQVECVYINIYTYILMCFKPCIHALIIIIPVFFIAIIGGVCSPFSTLTARDFRVFQPWSPMTMGSLTVMEEIPSYPAISKRRIEPGKKSNGLWI